MKENQCDIAIIGGGASGAVTAVRLLHSGFKGRLALITRDEEIARGPAYATKDRHHLLNVRAGKMSAIAEEPSHFVDWLKRKGHTADGLADAFMPRKIYGDYLQDVLLSAAARTTSEFVVLRDEAQGLASEGSRLHILLGSGSLLEADQVVLALGNLPPKAPKPYDKVENHPRWVANPWEQDALDNVRDGDSVLIVGTGLTMVDVVLTLKGRGHTGPVYARSRRGLLSQAHRSAGRAPEERPTSVDGLIRACREAGDEWRDVIDSIRSETPKLWSSLCWDERRRLLSRLMAYWDVHRHRMPESVANLLRNLQEAGLLDARAGRAVSVEGDGFGLSVSFDDHSLSPDWIVNCTGPSCDWAGAKTPLLESAVKHGLLSYDPLGMGVLVDGDGRVGPTGRIWALGPICRGCRLETTAMPEIRVQARDLAERLLAQEALAKSG